MSAPTKDPNAYLAREIDLLANDYHALGNRNRSIARDAISSYQARKLNVDDIIETRVTGQRSYFPADADTTERLRNLGKVDYEHPFPWRTFVLLAVLAAVGILVVKVVTP